MNKLEILDWLKEEYRKWEVFLSSVHPGRFKIVRHPERDRAALYQGFVVFRPVLDTV